MHSQKTHGWLETELQRGLRSVTAPPELWDRIQAPQAARSTTATRWFVWAMAAAVVLIAIGLSVVRRESVAVDETLAIRALSSDWQRVAFHCQNPAQLRTWVKANTGLDLPLRAEPSPSIQLIGARMIDGARGVEVTYRAGNRDAVLLVRGHGGADVSHSRVSGQVSSWVMAGQRFTLACDNAADMQLACRLCHLD
jgi:hypothetical protein